MRSMIIASFAVLAVGGLTLLAGNVRAQDESTAPTRTRSAEAYAKSFAVSVAEAQRRIQLQRQIGELNARLERDEAATFAGLVIEHRPAFRVLVKFTADAEATLARYTKDPLYVPATGPVAYRQMVSAQASVYDLLKTAGIDSSSRVDVVKGTVEFYVADPAQVQQLQTAGTLRLPAFVTIHKAVSMDKTREATIEGGRPLSGGRCTTGFTVYNKSSPASRYITTAGHCATPLTYMNVTLARVGYRYEAYTSYDYAWHSTAGFTTPTNNIYDGIDTSQRINYVWPKSNMAVGDWICKWGAATGFTCGNIASKSYNAFGDPGFIQVHDYYNTNLSDEGDSGAPWYYDQYQEAWGSHSDSADAVNPNDAIFMPIEYISASNLAVLTSP
jgi:hypothetical protein